MIGTDSLLKKLATTMGLIALLSLASCGDKDSESEDVAEVAQEDSMIEDTLAEVDEVIEDTSNEMSQEDYLAAQAAYLEANATKEGVVVTNSGLQYRILESAGSDERPTADDEVVVHYHGTFVSGDVFDSTTGSSPASFPLNRVIQGWTEGLQLMGVGDKFEFTIPAELGYGPEGYPGAIPGGATLIFEVELLAIL